MKKPTRRIAVTAAAIALAAGAVSVSAAHGAVHKTATAQLDGNRVAAASSSASAAHPTLSAPVPPASATPTTAGSVTPTTLVLPPAPGPAPAKVDAAAAAAAAANQSNNRATGGGSTKKAAAPAGGCQAGSSDESHSLDDASGSYPEHADIANAVYSLINSERAANCLPALGRSGQLNSSAHAHNVAMANTGDFDHQVPGEAGLGDRISATGYHWSSAGENIAWGSSASVSFAQQLETEMYNEPPNQPNHRANILSSSFHNVGVDVITDSTGKMWITCDFGS